MGLFQLASNPCDRAEEPLLIADEQIMPLLKLGDGPPAGADLQSILEQAFKPGQVGFQRSELAAEGLKRLLDGHSVLHRQSLEVDLLASLGAVRAWSSYANDRSGGTIQHLIEHKVEDVIDGGVRRRADQDPLLKMQESLSKGTDQFAFPGSRGTEDEQEVVL